MINIAEYRLYNQQIARPEFEKPGQVVAWLGAVQAQDYPGALWSIGLRTPGAMLSDVEQAIADRAIIRTWPMRGTLHFVAPEDVRWMLALLTPRVAANSAGRRAQLGLDETIFARSKELFARALQGGKRLERKEMLDVLERGGITTGGQRGYHILWRLAQSGLICFGPMQGKQPTFVLLDEWVPQAGELPRDEALARLAARYFTGHGPATLGDFMWWSGLTAADARAGLEMAKAQLVSEQVGGQTCWMPENIPASQDHATYLLPGFDEYLLGYKDRSAVLDPQYADLTHPGNNGMFSPTVVIGGRVAGTWKRTFVKGMVVITPQPFTAFSKDQEQAIAAVAERYGRFVGLSSKVVV